MCKKDKYKGFSLLELIIVVLLIGITSAIAIPNINDWITDRAVKKELYDVVSLINKKKSEVMSGKYGMAQIRLKQRIEIYTLSVANYTKIYKNINANNSFKNNKICDFKWRGMPTLVRHRDEELLLSVSDPTKKSKVHVWPNPAHNPGETVICITKEGNIKFSRTNPNETDPDTGQKVDLFIFCSKKNTNQNTCKQNTKEKYQYKITWDKFTNLKIYKYNLKKDKWILQ